MFNLNEYQTCAERLELFWKDHPDGRIDTKLIDFSGGRYIVQAFIYRTEVDAHAWASGLAEETIAGRGVNATSALENCETSALARALANAGYSPKGDPSKRASREEMSKVQSKNVAQSAIADVKAKMAQTATEYVPVPTENPWAIDDGAPVQTIDGAVALLKQEMGARGEGDIPNCTKCHDHKPMTWKSGMGKNGKPYGKFDCWTCKDVIWYEVVADGSWKPQKAKW